MIDNSLKLLKRFINQDHKPCSMCGVKDWSTMVNEKIYVYEIARTSSQAAVPVVIATCNECGHLEMFSAKMLGVGDG